MTRPIKVGLVGAGRWGKCILRSLDNMDELELCFVASGNPDTLSLVQEKTVVGPDWKQLLDEHAIDGLLIASPPSSHFEIAHYALENNVSVFIEKPVTDTTTTADRLLKQAQARQLTVFVDHIHLFSPAYRNLKKNLSRIGKVRSITCEAGNNGPYRQDASVLWDWAPHDLALCLDLLNTTPDTISAHTLQDVASKGSHIEINLTFPQGVQCQINCSNLRADKKRFLRIDGEEGSLIYDDLADDKLTFSYAQAVELALECSGALPLNQALAEFAQSLQTQKQDIDQLMLGCHVIQILEECEHQMGI